MAVDRNKEEMKQDETGGQMSKIVLQNMRHPSKPKSKMNDGVGMHYINMKP